MRRYLPRFLRRWLCNLGLHVGIRDGGFMQLEEEYRISDGETVTLTYLECHDCGADFPGRIEERTTYRAVRAL